MIPEAQKQQMAEAVAKIRETMAAAARLGLVQDILVEINIGEEASKSGVDADSLFPLLEAAAALPHGDLRHQQRAGVLQPHQHGQGHADRQRDDHDQQGQHQLHRPLRVVPGRVCQRHVGMPGTHRIIRLRRESHRSRDGGTAPGEQQPSADLG